MVPNFLGLGAQKSGTTWLHYMLIQHPDIYLPKTQKELHFFDNKKYYRQGIEYYQSYFSAVSGETAVGEITPGYLWSEQTLKDKYCIAPFRSTTPKRVKEVLGNDIKLIVILRNPVLRAVSAYFHHLKRKRVSYKDSILDIGTKMGILHMGFYYKHLENWLDYFSLKNFHISTFENMKKDKEAYLKSIFNFLGVDDSFSPKDKDKQYQINADYTRLEDGAFYLNIKNLAISKTEKSPVKAIDLNELEKLRDLYEEDIQKLKNAFALDLTAWEL